MQLSAILFIAGIAYGVLTLKPVLTTIIIACAAALTAIVLFDKKQLESTEDPQK